MKFTGVIFENKEITDQSLFDELPAEMQAFYSQMNGIVAYEGGFQVRGCVNDLDWFSLRKIWKGDWNLYETYDSILPSDIPFAQDGFGDQFLLRDGLVYKLHAEHGELEKIGIGFIDFMKLVTAHPVEILLLESFKNLYETGTEIKEGELMNVTPPFVFETKNKRTFKAVPVRERLLFLKSLYDQIKNMKNGDRVGVSKNSLN
ncbi:MAG: SMI1/KNR4 family protein [Saprospiraceae bacterium]